MLNGSFWVGQNKIMTSWLKIIILLTFFCLILVEKIFHNIKIWLKVRGCCARLFPGIIKSLDDIIVVHQVIVPVTDLCEKTTFRSAFTGLIITIVGSATSLWILPDRYKNEGTATPRLHKLLTSLRYSEIPFGTYYRNLCGNLISDSII